MHQKVSVSFCIVILLIPILTLLMQTIEQSQLADPIPRVS